MAWMQFINEQQDRGNKGAASNPQQNPVGGWSSINDGSGSNGLVNGSQVVTDASGNVITDPKLIAQYNAAVKGNYVNSPYVPLF